MLGDKEKDGGRKKRWVVARCAVIGWVADGRKCRGMNGWGDGGMTERWTKTQTCFIHKSSGDVPYIMKF